MFYEIHKTYCSVSNTPVYLFLHYPQSIGLYLMLARRITDLITVEFYTFQRAKN